MNRIGLSNEATKKVAEHLDQHLADLHVLYTKLHNYHWNVEGAGFFTLHAKLEELYDAVAEEIDAVAERILMIGHRPTASLAAYLEKAKLKEAASAPISSRDLAVDLLADYGTLVAGLRSASRLLKMQVMRSASIVCWVVCLNTRKSSGCWMPISNS